MINRTCLVGNRRRLDNIKEEIFTISENKRLYSELFGTDPCDLKNRKYAYAVYTSDKELIRGFQAFHQKRSWIGMKKSLVAFIKLYNPSSYREFLFFLSMAPMNPGEPSVPVLFERKFKKNEMIDHWLGDTHGLMIWRYQFRQLLTSLWDRGWGHMKKRIESDLAMRVDPDPYITLEAGLRIDTTREYYMGLMKLLKFSKHLSMCDVVKERGIGRFANPEVGPAHILYRAMAG